MEFKHWYKSIQHNVMLNILNLWWALWIHDVFHWAGIAVATRLRSTLQSFHLFIKEEETHLGRLEKSIYFHLFYKLINLQSTYFSVYITKITLERQGESISQLTTLQSSYLSIILKMAIFLPVRVRHQDYSGALRRVQSRQYTSSCRVVTERCDSWCRDEQPRASNLPTSA